MPLAAKLVADHHPSDRRTTTRWEVASDSTLRSSCGRPVDIIVRDLSTSGCRIDIGLPLEIGAVITLGLPGVGQAAAIVVRVEQGGYGCQWVRALSQAEVGTAFAETTLIDGRFRSLLRPVPPVIDAGAQKWPLQVRMAVALFSSAALWVGLAHLL